jgi:NTE family protein
MNPGPTVWEEPPPRDGTSGPLGLVMGGGGARAAYQVGVLRALARRHPDLEIPVLTGVSAGAINAVHLAAHPGNFQEAVEDLARLWGSLTVEKVFRVDSPSLAWHALRAALQLGSGGLIGGAGIRSLVDTSPLRAFLNEALGVEGGPIPGIQEKIDAGRLRALGISTSSYSTGRSVTWIAGNPGVEEWERPLRRSRRAEITVEHVMASAALPLFFEAVELEGEWYGDGGIRLASPLSPVIHLGAHRILAISTRFERTTEEAARPDWTGYPPPAHIMGQLTNAIFLDLLDQDAWRTETVNHLLRKLPPGRRGDFQVLELLTLRPSRDLGRLAGDFEVRLPGLFRFLLRGLGTGELKSPDVLSLLLFEHGYLTRLMEVGERDGEARMGELTAIIDPERARPPPSQEEPDPDAIQRARRRRLRLQSGEGGVAGGNESVDISVGSQESPEGASPSEASSPD